MTLPMEILEDYPVVINHIKDALKRSRGNSIKDTMKTQDDDEIFSNKERSETLYSKSSYDFKINFEDFEIVSIIGKGTFGKVYLVLCQ